MAKIYWLDDYRKVKMTLEQSLEKIKSSKARIRELQEELIKDIKHDDKEPELPEMWL
jgi:hypothetical protein